jgi:anti-sigma B factor antagonist
MTAARSRAPTKLASPPDELRINVVRDGGVCVVLVSGELDLATAPQLRQALDTAWRRGKAVRTLIVNVRDVTFCDAQGIGVLFTTYAAAARADVEFGLAGCGPRMLRLLSILDPGGQIPTFPAVAPPGHASLLPPEPTRPEASRASLE